MKAPPIETQIDPTEAVHANANACLDRPLAVMADRPQQILNADWSAKGPNSSAALHELFDPLTQ